MTNICGILGYTRRCIIKYLFLLYKRVCVYNKNKYFIIHESVFLLTRNNANKIFIVII